jgi:uncharacterized membrane protein YfcA
MNVEAFQAKKKDWTFASFGSSFVEISLIGKGKLEPCDSMPESDVLADECSQNSPDHIPFCTRIHRFISRFSELIIAVIVGIFHGIAGAGGVLAVVPAISMRHDSHKTTAYLLMFFSSSIITMGALAALWGELASRLGSTSRLEYLVTTIAALFSFLVGVLWEVLLALNLLDKVFH